ncbi:hypothetical protein [uncultured Methanofollis sp.]|uniref:hypothetical protein n=1 Tax=uncultured Methanofollis sp. TaxID=262500 RepID=UPI0026090F82|nr:hypothetical protein [uncultured Methanofollis sp.]
MAEIPLYVLVEGPDDERFFDRVIAPLFAARGYETKVWKYACEKRLRTMNLIRAVRKAGIPYVFVRDIDRTPYAARRVRETLDSFGHAMEAEMVVIVIAEIESWYLAGVRDEEVAVLGLPPVPDRTEGITKEIFNALIPRGVSRIEFMQVVLDGFDVGLAKLRNRSFRYFMDWFVEGGRVP